MSKTQKKQSGPRDRRTFGDNLAIRDATPADGILAFAILDADWQRGIRNDPRRCANARTIQRALGLPPPEKHDVGLAVYRTVAYVPLPNPNVAGGWEVLRYDISELHDKKKLAHRQWDEGKLPEPQMVRLVPPSPNRRLDARKQYRRLGTAKKRRPHKKVGWKACRVRGGLFNHHQTQLLAQ